MTSIAACSPAHDYAAASIDAAAPPASTMPSPGMDASTPPAPPAACDVRDYGARGDGVTKDTAAIQAALDACAGGGTVYLRAGRFLSGMVRVKSQTTLLIDAGATLLGSQDDADYPDTNPPTANTQLHNCRKALVYAESAHDVRITGAGTIDGNGNVPKWIGPSTVHPEATRPMAIYTALSQNVTIDSITMQNAAMWGIVNLEADNLVIRNVTVHTLLSGNRDGIDIVDCHHVLVEGCTIASEDDSICIKSGVRRGVDDVTIRNNHVLQSIVANGLKFGTASYGSFSNVTFDTNTIEHVDKAAMAVESVDGADVSNIVFKNIVFHDVGTPFFVILGDRGTTPGNDVHKIGSVDGVEFHGITGDGVRYDWGAPVSGTTFKDGTTARLKHLVFDGVHVTVKGGLGAVPADPPEYAGQYPDPNLWGNLPGYGFFVRHVDGFSFTSSTLTVATKDARPPFALRDAVNVTMP